MADDVEPAAERCEQALVLVGAGQLESRGVAPASDENEEEFLVRVEYSSVQPLDGQLFRGEVGFPPGPDAVPGSDGVGTVLRSRCGAFAPGDRIAFVFRRFGEDCGSWRSSVVLSPARACIARLPRDMEFQVVAAGVTSTCVALACLRHFNAGDAIIVAPAAGAVCSALVQLAALRHIRVLGLVRGCERGVWLTSTYGHLGTVSSVDISEEDWPSLAASLTDVTADGGGADGFVDGCGGQLRAEVCRSLVRIGGKVVTFGDVAGAVDEAAFDAVATPRRLDVHREGVQSFCAASDAEAQLQAAVDMMARNRYRPHVWQLVHWRDAGQCLVKQPHWGKFPSQVPSGPGGGRRVGRIILKID